MSLTLVPAPAPEATRVRKPNRRPGSCPVIQLPATPESDRQAAARYFHGLGWSALDAFHVGLDAELCAAIWMLEEAPS